MVFQMPTNGSVHWRWRDAAFWRRVAILARLHRPDSGKKNAD